MSYERQRTVADGDEIIHREDSESRDATRGTLGMGVGPDGKAKPTTHSAFDGQIITDENVTDLLTSILTELRIMNAYNAIAHENIIRGSDIQNDTE